MFDNLSNLFGLAPDGKQQPGGPHRRAIRPMNWTLEKIPDQGGRIAVVTGANTGIGYEMARALALEGARVILACRSRKRGAAALESILREKPGCEAAFEQLDLAGMDSVRDFAARIRSRGSPIDLLINNAGVMVPPRTTTAEGFELQLGVNHLGHFLLTGLLLERMANSPRSRIVTVSSLAHQAGRIDFASFRAQNGYKAFREYRQSKLANLVFALELDRRLVASRYRFRSMAAHPGITRTELGRHMRLFDAFAWVVGMTPRQGALPVLYAATAPEAAGGEYYGPDGFHEMKGYPARARIMPQARDPETARRLWAVSEELTGVRFPLLPVSPL